MSSDWRLSDWTVTQHTVQHPDAYVIFVTNYTSPPINLRTGDAHFTWNEQPTSWLPYPKGDHSILRSDYQLIGEDGKPTPLSEVYNHHWLIGSTWSNFPLIACEDTYFVGAGAEMRGMPVIYPHGYGVQRLNASGQCGGNLHFIRTEDLSTHWTGLNDPNGSVHAAVKNCMECGWAPHRAPQCLRGGDGSFACCRSDSRCPVNSPGDDSTKAYRLNYQIHWTPNTTAVKQVQMGFLDVSKGKIEWNVAPRASGPLGNGSVQARR